MKFRPPRAARFAARAADDAIFRLQVAMVMLVLVLITGVIGYGMLGLSLLDAVYQTVVTVTTVGFREIGPVDTDYKIFTIFLILFGTGVVLYTIGVFLEFLVEGRINDEFRRRRMRHVIEQLDGHVVVCGWGQVGQAIARSVTKSGNPVVVIDEREVLRGAEGVLTVVGDATDDDTLRRGGVEHAAVLVVALNSDSSNLFVTLSGRAMNPDLFIVARATSGSAEPKLRRAGADRVVNPHEIGGQRMAALVMQPHVADFLDVVMHDRDLTVRIEEVVVGPKSKLVHLSLQDGHIRRNTGATVLAVRQPEGTLVHNPALDLILQEGDILIALGTDDQLQSLNEYV